MASVRASLEKREWYRREAGRGWQRGGLLVSPVAPLDEEQRHQVDGCAPPTETSTNAHPQTKHTSLLAFVR